MFPLPSTVPSPSQIPAQALEYKIAFIKVSVSRLSTGVFFFWCRWRDQRL
jgi:hypothetical protein